jgi:hypothetical protein
MTTAPFQGPVNVLTEEKLEIRTGKVMAIYRDPVGGKWEVSKLSSHGEFG